MKRLFALLVASLFLSTVLAHGSHKKKKKKKPLFTDCHSHAEGHCFHCHMPCDEGDIFLQWNCIALEANVLDHNGKDTDGRNLRLTQGPPASARALAMIHLAMFDAYNLLTGLRYETNLPDLQERVDIPKELDVRRHRELHTRSGPPKTSPLVEAGVAAAAHTVMAHLYETSPDILAMMDAALERTMAADAGSSSSSSSSSDSEDDARMRDMGQYMGQQVGTLCLEDRRTDGYADEDPYLTQVTYTPTGMPGNHDVDPNNPQQGFFSPGVGGMTPLGSAMSEIAAFRAPLPPGLQEVPGGNARRAETQDAPTYVLDPYNEVYLENLEQVKTLGVLRGGTSTSDPLPLDDAGYHIANYWSYNGSPCTGTPPRLYNLYARQVAVEKKNTLDDNALLFTMLNVGLGNAGISAWDTKYYYKLWRPIMGIRQHPDGTVREDNWSPVGASRSNPYQQEQNFSPPFPAYTSGHAMFGAVAFQTLINFYGQNDIEVEFVSDEWNGLTADMYGRIRPLWPRTYDTLTMAMAENSASRVLNGVHWRFDGSAGVQAGIEIADYIFVHLFLPVPEQGDRIRRELKRDKGKNGKGKKKKNNHLETRTLTPAGDFQAAVDCILAHPDYQDTGACYY